MTDLVIPPKEQWATDLATAEVGQYVLVRSERGAAEILPITRTTPTQIRAGERRHTRKTGAAIGSLGYFSRTAYPLTEERVDSVRRQHARQSAMQARDRLDGLVRDRRAPLTAAQWETLRGLMEQACKVVEVSDVD